jgi:hypothetical protein
MKSAILAGLLLCALPALALTPAAPRIAPPGADGATTVPTTHQNQFTFAASADSTAASPGTTNLYKISGGCPTTPPTTTAGFTLVSSGNPPSATASSPVVDTNVQAGNVEGYVVTAVIGQESPPSNCVTLKTPTFPASSLAATSY